MHRCDCSPPGFKSSHYSPRATVLLQMLIVFSFSLSPSASLSRSLSRLPFSPSLFTLLILYTLSHTLTHTAWQEESGLKGGFGRI